MGTFFVSPPLGSTQQQQGPNINEFELAPSDPSFLVGRGSVIMGRALSGRLGFRGTLLERWCVNVPTGLTLFFREQPREMKSVHFY